jgi:hypothetical protein
MRMPRDTEIFAHAGLAFGGDELWEIASVPLSEPELLAQAEEMTGLSDWGPDESFRVGLKILVDAIEEMSPPPEWRHSFRRQILHLLNQRLHLRDDELRHPEVLDERIERPILIVGLPRTGTTLTHELLALDANARAPLNWEYAAPWPPPERATFDADPRIAKVNTSWKAQTDASPDILTKMPVDAKLPSECNDSMMYHFAGPNFWAWMGVPKHRRFTADQTAPGLYRTHKRILQELQWKGPRGRWTLKSPGFVGDLSAILDEYPDACLIWTHRDPATTYVSLASLVSSLQQALLGRKPDPAEIGWESRELWSAALERGLRSRDDPRVEAATMDVAYRDLVADKVGTVRRIYERFDLELDDAHVRRIRQLEVEQPSSQFAQHRYTTDEFGVDRAEVEAELPAYYERFGDLLAKRS